MTTNLNIHLEDPVSTKSGNRELYKANIHERAATAKSLIQCKLSNLGVWKGTLKVKIIIIHIYIYIYICGVMIIKPGQLEHQDELLTFNPDKSTDFNIVLERLCPLTV